MMASVKIGPDILMKIIMVSGKKGGRSKQEGLPGLM
jgi:hypothetical protein